MAWSGICSDWQLARLSFVELVMHPCYVWCVMGYYYILVFPCGDSLPSQLLSLMNISLILMSVLSPPCALSFSQLNCVVMNGLNEDEILDFVAFTESKVGGFCV